MAGHPINEKFEVTVKLSTVGGLGEVTLNVNGGKQTTGAIGRVKAREVMSELVDLLSEMVDIMNKDYKPLKERKKK